MLTEAEGQDALPTKDELEKAKEELESLGVYIHILRGTGRLSSHEGKIRHEAQKALRLIREKLPIDNVDIVFRDKPSATIEGLGIVGHTLDSHNITVSLDPGFENFEKTIEEGILRTLAHEAHHVLRKRGPGYGRTLLEALVSEGLADHFEIEITGADPPPWTQVLTEDQIEKFMSLARNEFNSRNYDHSGWFFGKKDIPKWTGYSLGFHIVGEYLNDNPQKRASQLWPTSTEVIAQKWLLGMQEKGE